MDRKWKYIQLSVIKMLRTLDIDTRVIITLFQYQQANNETIVDSNISTIVAQNLRITTASEGI